ncbi:MAG: lytic transglycosylase domain-containing protein [Pseudomonadota bacterium]
MRRRDFLTSSLLLAATPATGLAAKSRERDPALAEALRRAAHDTETFEDRFEAEVWLKDMSARIGSWRVKNPDERVAILKGVHREAARIDLSPGLVLAVIECESNFDRFAISVAGARGLMQVMPFWLDEIGKPNDSLFDIDTNLRMGCTILRHYYDWEKGDLHKCLARYNGSVGSRRYSGKVLDRLRTRWRAA